MLSSVLLSLSLVFTNTNFFSTCLLLLWLTSPSSLGIGRTYGENVEGILNNLRASFQPRSTFSTNSWVLTFQQHSLNYIKVFLKNLVLLANWDITDVMLAAFYIQFSVSEHFWRLLHTFYLSRVTSKKWAEILYLVYFHFHSRESTLQDLLNKLDQYTWERFKVNTLKLPIWYPHHSVHRNQFW